MNELVKIACELPIAQRRELIQKVRQSIIDEEHAISAKDRFDLVKNTVESVTDHKIKKGRIRQDVLCRMYIAYIMHNDGYSYSTIGRLLDRKHCTILHLTHMMKDMLSLPSVYQDEVANLNKIESLLQDGERRTEDN